MRTFCPFTIILLILGCFCQPQEAQVVAQSKVVGPPVTSYPALAEAPDTLLDELWSKYSGNPQQWRDAWQRENSKTPIDGQRTVRLLEIACYADVICHPIEFPLRIATHKHVREHSADPEVRDALNWIRASYNSRLPLDTPGDDTGEFKGLLVKSMKVRMAEYARDLLMSRETTDERE